jgi:hypothetical protein
MSPIDKSTELFLNAQGYDPERIRRALGALAGRNDDSINPAEPTLTPKELCQTLKISITTLWRMNPPHILVGARKRYIVSEVRKHLDEKRIARRPLAANRGS